MVMIIPKKRQISGKEVSPVVFHLPLSSHGKGQAHVHAAGVVLHWRVHELLDPSTGSGWRLGKVHDLIELAVNPSAGSGQVSARFIPSLVLSLVLSSVEGLSKG